MPAFTSLKTLKKRRGQMPPPTPKLPSLFAIMVQMEGMVGHEKYKIKPAAGTHFQNLLQPVCDEFVKMGYIHWAANCLTAPLRSGRMFRHCTSKHRTLLRGQWRSLPFPPACSASSNYHLSQISLPYFGKKSASMILKHGLLWTRSHSVTCSRIGSKWSLFVVER